MSEIDPVEFGELRATVSQLERTVSELTKTVGVLTSHLDQAKGGWRVIIACFAAGATVSGALAWVLQYVQIRH